MGTWGAGDQLPAKEQGLGRNSPCWPLASSTVARNHELPGPQPVTRGHSHPQITPQMRLSPGVTWAVGMALSSTLVPQNGTQYSNSPSWMPWLHIAWDSWHTDRTPLGTASPGKVSPYGNG